MTELAGVRRRFIGSTSKASKKRKIALAPKWLLSHHSKSRHRAIHAGQRCEKRQEITATEFDGSARALRDAAERGDVVACLDLLSAGVDASSPDEDGHTALHLAAKAGHLGAARLLCEFSANPNAPTLLGNTPLHGAAYKGRLDIVDLLMAWGADKARRNRAGQTPADRAVECGQRDVAAFLSSDQSTQN